MCDKVAALACIATSIVILQRFSSERLPGLSSGSFYCLPLQRWLSPLHRAIIATAFTGLIGQLAGAGVLVEVGNDPRTQIYRTYTLMRIRWWEYILIMLFLSTCLVAGLAIGDYFAPQPVIGVVRFEGVIDFAAEDYLISVLDAARTDGRVAGVVVDVLSPGGFATSSESIYHTMLELRDVKPLVVHIDGLAASGGYFMAAASNRIYAAASAYVGNVGARTIRPFDPAISPAELSTGPYKLSGGDRFDQIRQLTLVGKVFVDSVVHQRQNAEDNPLTVDASTVAEARIYLGSEAVGLGLIDREGSRSDAILGAAELAGLSDYGIVDLAGYLGITPPQTETGFARSIERMVASAPPETIYLLDSRISLGDLAASSDLNSHLLRLRPTHQSHFRTPQSLNLPDFLRNAAPAAGEQ